MATPSSTIPTNRKIAFASGEFGFNLAWQSIELFLLFYYTDVLGLSPWWAGIVFALGSVWDGVLDPVVGSLADRTRTRWGRFRPWVAVTAPAVGVTLAAAFYKPALAGVQLSVYALITHLALRTAYTASSIPYLSLSARITADGKDRTTIAGFRMQFAAFAGLVVSLGYPFITAKLGGGIPSNGFAIGSIAFGLLLVPVLLNAIHAASEPEETVELPKTTLARIIAEDAKAFTRMALHNGPFMRVLLAVMLTSLALTMVSKATLYYFKYYLQAPELAKYSLALGALKFVALAPIWAWFANRTSKRIAWLWASGIAAAGLIALYFVPPTAPWLAFWLLFLVGIGSAGYAVLFWAMLPDTVEVNELMFGARDEAKVFSFALFARKLALAVNAFLLGALLTASGFVPNQVQSAQTLWGLKALFTLIPLFGAIGSAAIMWNYRLDAAEHRRLRDAIAAPRDPLSKDAPS